MIARLRPSILIGAQMPHALGAMFRRGLIVHGGAPMPMVWDEDVADAIVLALRKRAHGAFNLNASEPLSAPALAKAAGMRAIYVPPLVRRGLGLVVRGLRAAGARGMADPAWLDAAVVTMVSSSERALGELGWKPRFPTSADVMRHYREVASHGLDHRLRLFFRLLELGARRLPPPAEARTVSMRIHLQLTGPGGGDVGLTMTTAACRWARRPGRPTRW